MFLPTLIGMVSMVVLNITDGVFDEMGDQEFPTTILKHKSVQQMGHTVWMRYDF